MSEDMCSCQDLMSFWNITAQDIADLMINNHLFAYYWKGKKSIDISKINNEPLINKGVINYKIAHGISEEVIFDNYTIRSLNRPKSYYRSLTNDQVKSHLKLSKSDSDYGLVILYGDRNVIRPWPEHVEKQSIAETARGLYFRVKDINRYAQENSLPIMDQISFESIRTQQLQGQQKTFKTKDAESFIRSLQVFPVGDQEIKIRANGKNAKIFEKKDLGFSKANAKYWNEFINILNSPDHLFHVGKAHGVGGERINTYDTNQKVLVEINKKLVSFFIKTYQIQPPEKFKVYELVPGKAAPPGTYRFKFQIINDRDADIQSFKAMPKDQLLQEIEKLSSQCHKLLTRGDETSEKRKNNILDQLNNAMTIALENEWLTQKQITNYLNSDPFISNEPITIEVPQQDD